MKRFSLTWGILSLLMCPLFALADGGSADGPDYTNGVFFINEDWYGHQNSTVNFLVPDDPAGEYWHYRVIQSENPGVELGCTNQYGVIWNGRLYLIAKQEKDPGADITGGRITVADAKTMKVLAQLEDIDPSGNQCDGRAFCGVDAHKGYVSTSNGVWILDLDTFTIVGQVRGTANPNAGGDNDKPNTDPTGSLYHGQCGSMILAAGKVFVVHQQYGLLLIDPSKDEVIQTLDMKIVDEAEERLNGTPSKKPAGIGSGLVMSKDGFLFHSVAQNVSGNGAVLPYIVKVNPETLERKLIRIEGEGMYAPKNSWYAWTPDPFCASKVKNTLYWCGGANRWFKNETVFRFDVDTETMTKILDFAAQDGDWSIYGCSLGIDPIKDELYCSLFHQFGDPTYTTRRYDADGNLIKDYPMISNYWFPSLPVFPGNQNNSNVENVESAELEVVCNGSDIYVSGCDADIVEAYAVSGLKVAESRVKNGRANLMIPGAGAYILRAGSKTKKIKIFY